MKFSWSHLLAVLPVCRCRTRQEDAEMREVVTAAACSQRRNTVALAALAVPATLAI